MDTIASQITSLVTVYSTVYSDADQRKHQTSASLAFVRGIHRGPVNSPHKWPVTRKMFPFDDVIMGHGWWITSHRFTWIYLLMHAPIPMLASTKLWLWYSRSTNFNATSANLALVALKLVERLYHNHSFVHYSIWRAHIYAHIYIHVYRYPQMHLYKPVCYITIHIKWELSPGGHDRDYDPGSQSFS